VTQWELHLNSIGDENCRPQYVARLNEWLDAHADVLDEDARHKRATSPLQVFDVKNPTVRSALEDAPKIGESLCDACREHFEQVQRLLDALGVPYLLDPTLVRGLDYYSRTTFEFIGPDENANSTICGGGRYDGLVEAIGGAPTPGIGFGAGLERLLLALENEGISFGQPQIEVFLVVEDASRREAVLVALAALRRAGVSADTDYAGRSLKGQMTQAARSGATTVVIVRSDEVAIRREGRTILFGGDTAQTESFRQHRTHGPYDLAIMPIGAYDPWILNHCSPEQAVDMANQAGARYFIPIHHQTFRLSHEPMLEPIERAETALAKETERLALRQVGETFICPKA